MTLIDYDDRDEAEPVRSNPIEVPISSLSADALLGLVEEYVTRDGTDYGHREKTIEDKKAAIIAQLRSREALVVFDLSTATPNIVSREELVAAVAAMSRS